MVANAIKASGSIVRVEPSAFLELIGRADAPLVVVAEGGVFSKHYRYLTSYKGLAFFTKSGAPLVLPRKCETMRAEKIWIPDL
jgi:hypothetical protein